MRDGGPKNQVMEKSGNVYTDSPDEQNIFPR